MHSWFTDSRAPARTFAGPARAALMLATTFILAIGGCTGSEPTENPFSIDIVVPPAEGACEVDADCEDPAADALGACEADACVEGFCEVVFREDGSLCDDLDICTTDDGCLEGVCGGEARVCDDGESCTEDTCDGEVEGGCVYAPLEGDCDDGDACTTDDICLEGVCGGPPVDCSALDTACAEGTCLGEAGLCAMVPLADGESCDDDNPCTNGDVCGTGTCAGSPVDCTLIDDECGFGLCDPSTGTCVLSPSNDGGECDDGDACTEGDVCGSGSCGGTPVDCSDLEAPCATVSCDGSAGGCVAEAVADGTTCDDGDPCTDGDTCATGVCAAGPSLSCDNGDVCDGDETCDSSSGCTTGTPLTCDDQDPCTDDVCDATGGCTTTWNGTCACAGDADCAGSDTVGLCDGTLTCVDNTCVVDPDSVVPCDTSADGACETTACETATGQCVTTPVADEDQLTCEDGDACTTGDICVAGACTGTAVDCTGDDTPGTCDGTLACVDGTCQVDAASIEPCDTTGDSACATTVCDATSGGCVVEDQDGADCDDGDLCTVGDSCATGACVAGAAPDCSALDGDCQSGTCDAGTGDCVAAHFGADQSCDDGDVCTEGDLCDGAGTCVSGANIDCTDANPCTDDTVCDPDQGCTHPALDGDNCDDGVGCTDGDTCDANAICAGTPNDDNCGNGLYCDGTETCDASADCVSGSPEDCSALDSACTAGECEEGANAAACVVSNLDGDACDDGDACTFDDACGAGTCGGSLLDPCPYNDPNLLCTGSGSSGDRFSCALRAVRACEAVPYTGTIQWYLSWDPTEVTLLGFTDRDQDVNQWPADYLYGIDNGLLPGYMPTAQMGPFGPVPVHGFTSTTPGADGTWNGEMNIAVYTGTGGIAACEAPLPAEEQCTSPIVDAYRDAGGQSVGESLIFNAHFELATNIDGATPSAVSLDEVVANDPLLQNFTLTLDAGISLLDYEDSACE